MAKFFIPLFPLVVSGCLIAADFGSVNSSTGETGLVALALLRDGFIGDPYLIPTGPTAHAAPGTVALLAVVYDSFGGNTIGARITLSLIALLQYQAASVLVAGHVNTVFTGQARFIALCLSAGVLPLYLTQAIVSYRQWDQPTSALLLALTAHVWLRANNDPTRWRARAMCLGLLGRIGSLFAPVLRRARLDCVGRWLPHRPRAFRWPVDSG